jgi:hypothetical protein
MNINIKEKYIILKALMLYNKESNNKELDLLYDKVLDYERRK